MIPGVARAGRTTAFNNGGVLGAARRHRRFIEPAPRGTHKAPRVPFEARVANVPGRRSRRRRRLTTTGWHWDHPVPRSDERQHSPAARVRAPLSPSETPLCSAVTSAERARRGLPGGRGPRSRDRAEGTPLRRGRGTAPVVPSGRGRSEVWEKASERELEERRTGDKMKTSSFAWSSTEQRHLTSIAAVQMCLCAGQLISRNPCKQEVVARKGLNICYVDQPLFSQEGGRTDRRAACENKEGHAPVCSSPLLRARARTEQSAVKRPVSAGSRASHQRPLQSLAALDNGHKGVEVGAKWRGVTVYEEQQARLFGPRGARIARGSLPQPAKRACDGASLRSWHSRRRISAHAVVFKEPRRSSR
ncbi:hypothetical protein SKAU_G00201210 [Synaphobranchus kaupii]|uniref:Uncharacterized protein n=1 Tax=Synaphobranchus kaupii TaxID=118154 RepID=A0A9Q1FFH8_SYNKA|nr:hypothetical protein SKAU_G00201210 [Synaphobranchus kaupii]